MKGITAETAAWLAVLRNYRRTAHWQSLETAVLFKYKHNCALCGSAASTVKHLTYLTICQEADTDVMPYCNSCRMGAGRSKSVPPGYLSPEIKIRMQEWTAAHPPSRSIYLKASKNTLTDPDDNLKGSHTDIAYARSLYLALLGLAAKQCSKTIRVQRYFFKKVAPMSASSITRALNLLHNHGWIARHVNRAKDASGEYVSHIVIELRKNVDKPWYFTKSREQEQGLI